MAHKVPGDAVLRLDGCSGAALFGSSLAPKSPSPEPLSTVPKAHRHDSKTNGAVDSVQGDANDPAFAVPDSGDDVVAEGSVTAAGLVSTGLYDITEAPEILAATDFVELCNVNGTPKMVAASGLATMALPTDVLVGVPEMLVGPRMAAPESCDDVMSGAPKAGLNPTKLVAVGPCDDVITGAPKAGLNTTELVAVGLCDIAAAAPKAGLDPTKLVAVGPCDDIVIGAPKTAGAPKAG